MGWTALAIALYASLYFIRHLPKDAAIKRLTSTPIFLLEKRCCFYSFLKRGDGKMKPMLQLQFRENANPKTIVLLAIYGAMSQARLVNTQQ